MLTIKDLNECFHQAEEVGANYVAVKIHIGLNREEVIINPRQNFEEKRAYYNHAYNHNLRHNFADGQDIRIVSFTSGDTFAEIEDNLEVMQLTGSVLN